jgi:UDP-3-O-[3-hydroxymyristoyl] glucosamine N-acyltransferase
MGLTVVEVAAYVGGSLRGEGSQEIVAALPLAEAAPNSVTFVNDRRQMAKAADCKAGVVLVPLDAPVLAVPTITVSSPLEAMLRVAAKLHPPLPRPAPGIDARAAVDPTAKIGPGTTVGPFAVIEAGVVVGANCIIHPHAVVRAHCVLGDEVEIHPHAVLYPQTLVGDRSAIHAGAVVGREGFGYRFVDGGHRKVPQLGWTQIGRNVEIGANTTIDRATFGATSIGDGTKFDNLVQIGHNCRVGRDNLFVAHVGVGGSSTTGDRVVLAGKAGISDHVTIGDDAVVGAGSGVNGDIAAGERYFGYPAQPEFIAKRIAVSQYHLPQMRKQLAQICKRLGLDDVKGPDDESGERRRVG